MRTFVLILLPAAALVVWAIVEERKLRAMDSGAGKTMQQVGVRLAACLDAVAALLALSLCAMRRDKKKHAHEGGCGGGCWI